MRSIRIIAFFIAVMSFSGFVSAQTADEIISKYIQSIGGKEVISGIKSLYFESSAKAMGMKITTFTTIFNGKGYKTEIQVLGRKMITCYTDKSGWSANPRSNNKVEDMTQDQYNTGRNQIFIGYPFIDYLSKGYKAELIGRVKIGEVNAYKIGLRSSADKVNEYYFDPATGFLMKTTQKTKMEGKDVEIVTTYSDYYKTTCGYTIPLNTEINYGASRSFTSRITKITIDKPVSMADFVKPD